VAAYPETHPQARSPEADLKAFATKVRAGANSAITQMFFNADAYFRFVDEVRAMGWTCRSCRHHADHELERPDALRRQLRLRDPRWVRLRLQSFGDDVKSIRAFGLDVMSALCERLLQAGVPGCTFYTMNQAGPTLALCRRLAG
jgi:methylenetetrahydrofolate reductase (NADPH)